MNAIPHICPECGELVIAWVTGETLIIPIHTDRVTPPADCCASAAAVPAYPVGHSNG